MKVELAMYHRDYTPEFQSFWEAYPRRIAKRAAFGAFLTAKRVVAVSEIMDGAHMEQLRVDKGKPMQFVPHPDKWLRRRYFQ
ncbi:MAG: hypothetical protein GY800_05070 [Planctomycetes bacterium]|nr:hypothetical protein [Planctomycetota bacterium]